MSKFIRMPIDSYMSDDEVRAIAKSFPLNGSYATAICKNCGSYKCCEDGNSDTAIIVTQCSTCNKQQIL